MATDKNTKNAQKTPFSIMKDAFTSKEKLVAELEKFTKGDDLWVSRLNSNKGLAHISNAKLMKLHKTFSAVKEKFGTRAKLIDAILEIEKRTKDDGFKTRLGNFPVPRLWDLYTSASKRAARATKATQEKPAKKAAPKAAKPAAAAKPKTAPAKKKASAKKG